MKKRLKHNKHMPIQTKQLIDAINESLIERESVCLNAHNFYGAILIVLLPTLAISVFLNILAYT